MKKFGDYLKELRLERNLSQEELARMLNTTKQVISKYETNQRTPKVTIANEYAIKLGVELNYLLGSDGQKEKSATQEGSRLTKDINEITEIWNRLGEQERQELLRFARFQKSEQDSEQNQ